jgi:hypothetical protein
MEARLALAASAHFSAVLISFGVAKCSPLAKLALHSPL